MTQIICGKSRFEDDGMQYYLLFLPVLRYFKKKKKDANNDNVSAWKSKRLSDEILIINIIAPSLNYIYTKNTSKICWKVFKTRKSHIYS